MGSNWPDMNLLNKFENLFYLRTQSVILHEKVFNAYEESIEVLVWAPPLCVQDRHQIFDKIRKY